MATRNQVITAGMGQPIGILTSAIESTMRIYRIPVAKRESCFEMVREIDSYFRNSE